MTRPPASHRRNPVMTRPRTSLSIARGGLCSLVAVSLGVAGLPAVTNVAHAQAPAPLPGAAPAPARGQVTLNFVNADIEGVTRAIAAMIGRQIAVDPRVRGTITVYSEQPQSVRDAYQTYLTALRGMGFAMVESGGLLRVVPEAEAKLQTGTVSVGEVNVRGDQIITQIFALRHENANKIGRAHV